MKKQILLTGASGTVGSSVLQQLIEKDIYQITVFDKETSRAKQILAPYQNRIEIIYGDISQKESIEKATHKKDCVIHLAAIIPPLADEKPALADKVNVVGTKNLLECLEKNSPSAFFMYASSISIYGDRVKNPHIKVGDPLQPSVGDAYAHTKIKSENNIRNSRLDYTIFRLSAIMGYGNHKISGLMFHMPLETGMEICTPEDTARAFVNAIENTEKLSKNTYNLGGGSSCRILYKDFLDRSFRIYGLGKVNFPEGTFATQNFHCGYYVDGDDLEEILHFRRDTINTFFKKFEEAAPKIQRFFAFIFKGIIKKVLQKKSEPYHALRTDNADLKMRFFGK